MINACQIRAARAILNWSQQDLAEKSSLDRNVIKLAEKMPWRSQEASLAAILRVFEREGMSFSGDEHVVSIAIERSNPNSR